MNLLRRPVLAFAAMPGFRRVFTSLPLTRAVVDRFVPGETTADAVAAVAELRKRDLLATVDFLGEYVTDEAAAQATAESYVELLDELAAAGVAEGTEVSVKLSALGLLLEGFDGSDYGVRAAGRRATEIAARAYALGARMTIDMEDHRTVDATLHVLREVRQEFPDTGVAIQSMLRRTSTDLQGLVGAGSRVRLVKGAYDEPASVAYQGREAVMRAYLADLQTLMRGKGYPMLGSHDPAAIEAALSMAAEAGRDGDHEFQMLYGIRSDEQDRLRGLGHRVRVYVPYGQDWYGYFTRRLAERPENLVFFLRALFQRY